MAVICCGLLLISCSSTSNITGSWKNPARDAYGYKNVVVTALTSNIQAKTTVENNIAGQLSNRGVQALKGMEVFPPEFSDGEPQKEEMLREIRNREAEAILTIALIDEKTESRYVPGSYDYSPFPMFSYYGRFWGYYSYLRPLTYAQGYYVEDKVYFIEANIYDATSEQLIWSAQSEIYNPTNLTAFSEEFAKVLVQKLQRDKII